VNSDANVSSPSTSEKTFGNGAIIVAVATPRSGRDPTMMAPFPKVFSDVDGLETFASEFTLHWRDGRGAHAMPITPELYSRLRGAYNRRNVYGAALSYAPRLPEPLWRAVFTYAFAPAGPLRREFGLPPDAHDIAVEIRTRTRGRADHWRLETEATK
jgi:hypothetical protein